jgi:hypothetical protein
MAYGEPSLDQLKPEIRHAAGTLVSFRVGARIQAGVF